MEDFNVEDETAGLKLLRKIKETPIMPIGLATLLAASGIGAYKFRRSTNMPTSVFLMQLRVIAQGSLVGILTMGMAWNLIREHLFKANE